METPSIAHLSAEDYNLVYEPSQDSFLLLDALEDDLEFIQKLNPLICVEIGCGSGVVITALAKQLNNSLCISTDINSDACRLTKVTAQRNDTHVETLLCNLVDGLRERSIDLLVFNPPYVVTSDEELLRSESLGGLSSAWAGGIDGRRVIDVLLSRLDMILSSNGVLYLLLLRENKIQEIHTLLEEMNFIVEPFKERRIPGEYLYVFKITRKNETTNRGVIRK